MKRHIPSLVVIALASSLPLAAIAQAPAPAPRNVFYFDAHTHMRDKADPVGEMAAFRKAGIAGVAIMDPEIAAVRAFAEKNPGYAIPFISLGALQHSVVTPDTGSTFAKLAVDKKVCGFGEIATRLDPKQTDPEALEHPDRQKIYAAANANRFPVNMHVSLAEPATVAAIGRIAAKYPNMSMILAHAGLTAGPDVLASLFEAHPNVYSDLSSRMSPARAGEAPRPQSALTQDGVLKPEWRALIERYPGRVLFATDATGAGADSGIADKLALARKAFAPLPLPIEEAFAHGNLQRLLRGCTGV